MEMKRNPKNAFLAPIHQALQTTRNRRSHSDEDETEFEIAVCEAAEERLRWGADRDSNGRRKLHLRAPRPAYTRESSQNPIIERDFIGTSQLAEIQHTLSVAIIADDVAFIEQLFESWDFDTDYDNQYFGRPLHLAAAYGRAHMIQILLDNGADLNAIQPYYGPHWSPKFTLEKEKFICSSRSALSVAAFNGHLDFIKVLVQPRFNLTLPLPAEELRDVIRAAARHGNLLLVSFLVDMYYEPGPLRSRIQEEVLLQAAYSGREELVEPMIATGVSVNCTASRDTYTMPDFSPIHCAAYKGRASITRILLSNGADRDHCNRSSMVRGSLTALGHAIGRDHENVVRILFDDGATKPTSTTTSSTSSSLYLTIYGHHHHMMRLLLEEAAYHNETIDWAKCMGERALLVVIMHGDLEMVRLMVEDGFPITTKVAYGDDPVVCAMKHKWAHIVKFLIDAGAKEIDPWDPETFPSDDFRSGRYPWKFPYLDKTPDQLWHTHGKY
jgi:ankyrin repeat protein